MDKLSVQLQTSRKNLKKRRKKWAMWLIKRLIIGSRGLGSPGIRSRWKNVNLLWQGTITLSQLTPTMFRSVANRAWNQHRPAPPNHLIRIKTRRKHRPRLKLSKIRIQDSESTRSQTFKSAIQRKFQEITRVGLTVLYQQTMLEMKSMTFVRLRQLRKT